jgi:hypothetical protein
MSSFPSPPVIILKVECGARPAWTIEGRRAVKTEPRALRIFAVCVVRGVEGALDKI